MSAAPINPYEISMDELARLATNVPVSPTVPPTEQPRDEQGRFIAVEPVVEAPEVEAVVEPLVEDNAPVEGFTATIDLEDGSGVQVFEGATKDELLEKLIAAQTNATRKIRELTAKPTPVTPPVLEVNPDDELALAQEFLSEPSKAFDKLYQKKFGETPEQTKARLDRADKAAETAFVNSAAAQFKAANPSYDSTNERNNIKIDKWIAMNRLPVTVENLQRAHDDLAADGLLAAKEVTPTTPTARTSGLSVRRSAAPIPVVKTAADLERESRALPIEKLRELAGGYRY